MRRPGPTKNSLTPSRNSILKPPRLYSILKQIGSAYFTLIKKIFFLILFIAAVAASGFAISYPLWIFATRSQKGYSLTVLLALAAGLAAVIIMRICRTRKISAAGVNSYKKRIARGFLYTGSIIGFIALLYLIVFLFSQGLLLYGVPLLILFLFFLGLFLYDIAKARV